MSSNFYAFLSRMKYINRWALMRNTNNENLSQHSHEVAAVAHALCVIGNCRYGKSYNAERAALLGLYHDMPEILTGDMPTPVKYFSPEIRAAYKKVEQSACKKISDTVPDDLKSGFDFIFSKKAEDEELWHMVKAADKISALIKCTEERKAGNMEFSQAEAAARLALEEMNSPEVNDFLNEFMPPFELTLDQLS